MIVDRINKYLSSKELKINDYIADNIGTLAKWSFKRQFMENGNSHSKISMSACGKCTRQLAYKYHDIPQNGKELDSRAKIVFWQGDLVETMITELAKLAGVNIMATGLNQLSLTTPVEKTVPLAESETVEVPGHPDGIVLSDETYLFECKSMSSYAFRTFEKGEIDDSYRAQVNIYMDALKLNACVIVAMSKDSGVLGELIVKKDFDIVQKCHDNLETVLNSDRKKLPRGWYEPNDKGLYPWQCLYCSWHGLCKPNAEKVLVGKAYKLKEKVKKEAI